MAQQSTTMSATALWREAATLILPCRISQKISANPATNTFDYLLPLLKRSKSNKFMPNSYVFPGGVVEESDFSPDWLQVIQDGGTTNQMRPKPPILHMETYSKIQQKFGERKILDPNIALRLTAIRETFEESGVLLARSMHKLPHSDKIKFDLDTLSSWRSKVSSDATQFIKMCEELKCYPDVWSLREWSNWLTPNNKAWFKRRFDTIFYVCTLNEIPKMQVDNEEISKMQWFSPSEALNLYREQKIWLAPPQVYELSRLQAFHSAKELGEFSETREAKGMERIYGIHIAMKDGVVSLLPGDDFCSTEVDVTVENTTLPFMEKTIRELRMESKNIHRIEMQHSNVSTPVCNIELAFGHVAPLYQPEFPNPKL